MRSGSGKYPSSIARSTSITSSWKSIRAIRNIQRSLRDIYVSTSGGGASGTATSNASAGTVTGLPARRRAQPRPPPQRLRQTPTTIRHAMPPSIRWPTIGKGSSSSGAAVSTAAETMIPLAAFSHYNPGNAPLSVNHQGLFVAATISFNLLPGAALGDAAHEIENAAQPNPHAGIDPRQPGRHGAGVSSCRSITNRF